MSFSNSHQGAYGQEKVISSTKGGIALGTRMVFDDGRVYYRCLVGGTTLEAGTLCMAKAADASADMDLTVALAAAVGDTTITVDLEAGAVAKNAFEDGYIYINDADGEGHTYKILSHPAAAGSDELIVTLYSSDPVAEALVLNTSLAGLVANPYNGVIVHNTTRTNPIVGVAATQITNAYYGWLQTWGPCCVLTGAAVGVLGDQAMPADTSADHGHGEVHDMTAANQLVGTWANVAAVDTDYGFIFLTIAP